MVNHMRQILVQLDDETAARLESVVPGRSRKRSAFIREAIARALLDALELRTRAAYERHPSSAASVDPAEWADRSEAIVRRRRP